MPDEVSQPKRVIATHSVRATRPGRRLIFLFIIVVIGLAVSLVFKIWPIAKISIKPDIHALTGEFQIKVDLDISSPNPATRVMPGRIMAVGEDSNILAGQNYFVRNIKGTSLVFSQADLDSVTISVLAKLAGEQATLLPESVKVEEGDWSVGSSGRLFFSNLTAHGQFYSQLPLHYWSQEIAGRPIKEVTQILSDKPGVDKVEVRLYPFFFSNISQKIPKDQSNIRFTLDTN